MEGERKAGQVIISTDSSWVINECERFMTKSARTEGKRGKETTRKEGG